MRLLKTQIFLKKSIFQVKKRLSPIFSLTIGHDQCQETLYMGPQGTLTKIVEIIISFLWDQ